MTYEARASAFRYILYQVRDLVDIVWNGLIRGKPSSLCGDPDDFYIYNDDGVRVINPFYSEDHVKE